MQAVEPNERWPNEADLLGERMGRLPVLAKDRQANAEANRPADFRHTAISI